MQAPEDPASETGEGERLRLTAPDGPPCRLDKLLAQLLPEHSRSYLKELAGQGNARVDGEVQEGRFKVRSGAEIELQLVPRHRLREGGDVSLPDLTGLYEDDVILVVDKPAGMASHPSGGRRWGTLSQAACAHCGFELPSPPGESRHGIVHRLDMYTSGVIALAKTEEALQLLQQQFRQREVQKESLALVIGSPRFSSEWIDLPIERDPKKPERMRVSRGDPDAVPEKNAYSPREASTFYEVMEHFDGFALLNCRPKTGRTHQIRVHLSAIGHPLLGEHIYKGRNRQGRGLPEAAPRPDRHLLHARSLTLHHPATGEERSFVAEPAKDFLDVWNWLRQNRPGKS